MAHDLSYTLHSRKLANIRILCSVPNQHQSTKRQYAQVFTVGIASDELTTTNSSSGLDNNGNAQLVDQLFAEFPGMTAAGSYANRFVSSSSSLPATSTSSAEYALSFHGEPLSQNELVKRRMKSKDSERNDKLQVSKCTNGFSLCGVTAGIVTPRYKLDPHLKTPERLEEGELK